MKIAVVTGGAGFVGMNLIEALLKQNVKIYMTARSGSAHNIRIPNTKRITVVEADLSCIELLETISFVAKPDVFFHLAWGGGRNDFSAQYANVDYTMRALRVAKNIGCRRFVCTGSQAEYGLKSGYITEETYLSPNTAYGAAKAAACIMSQNLAAQLDIEWVWGRIFSVYGKYEPHTTLISYLKKCFTEGKSPIVTKCEQNWDYLYSSDVAEAILAIAEKGKDGEIYNIANGNYKKLKLFIEEMKCIYETTSEVFYEKEVPFVVSLSPIIDKIKRDTGWTAKVSFMEGIVK